MPMDWVDWHRQYDTDGPLARRLLIVRRLIANVLESRGSESVKVLSICSGDARDLIPPLQAAGLAGAASGRLVELDARLAATARQAAHDASLAGIEVVNGDAGNTSAYAGAVPADLILLCGVFGNIAEVDIERTILALPMLCSRDAAVVWTRHRRPPDLTPRIRRWFQEAGFVNEAFVPVPGTSATVGLSLFRGQRRGFTAGVQLFEFSEYDANASQRP